MAKMAYRSPLGVLQKQSSYLLTLLVTVKKKRHNQIVLETGVGERIGDIGRGGGGGGGRGKKGSKGKNVKKIENDQSSNNNNNNPTLHHLRMLRKKIEKLTAFNIVRERKETVLWVWVGGCGWGLRGFCFLMWLFLCVRGQRRENTHTWTHASNFLFFQTSNNHNHNHNPPPPPPPPQQQQQQSHSLWMLCNNTPCT